MIEVISIWLIASVITWAALALMMMHDDVLMKDLEPHAQRIFALLVLFPPVGIPAVIFLFIDGLRRRQK